MSFDFWQENSSSPEQTDVLLENNSDAIGYGHYDD